MIKDRISFGLREFQKGEIQGHTKGWDKSRQEALEEVMEKAEADKVCYDCRTIVYGDGNCGSVASSVDFLFT